MLQQLRDAKYLVSWRAITAPGLVHDIGGVNPPQQQQLFRRSGGLTPPSSNSLAPKKGGLPPQAT